MIRKHEQGFILLEGVIALPILLLILASIVTISVASVRHFYRIYAMEELRYEVQEAMMRIVEDMSTASQVEWGFTGNEDGLRVHHHTDTGGRSTHFYFLHVKDHVKNMYYQSTDTPVTGKNDLATVQIEEFRLDKLGNGLYAVHIRGEVLQLSKAYELTTKVYVGGKGASK